MSGVNAAQVQERNASFNKPLFDNTMISQDQKMGITNAADAYMRGAGGGRMQNNQLLKSLHELIYNSGLPQELKDQLAGMGSYQGRAGKGGGMQAMTPDKGMEQVPGIKPKRKKKPKGNGEDLISSASGKTPVDVQIVGKRKKAVEGDSNMKPTIAVDKEPAPKPKKKPVGKMNRMMEY